ncbi:MAG TPA: aldo/keto reductase [Chloroflexia bacterium]|nr:aldo/keto reductase [Chloroflexia bacterium]
MRYKQLGHSGLLVTDLCLGTMIFGEDNVRGTPPEEAARMIDRYLDAGGNHLDTANVYAGGRSEEIVGQALKGKRDRVVLATKVRFATGQGPNNTGLSRRHIIEAVNASLKRLATDYIDLYYMHSWDPLTPLEESLRAFDDLVQSGKVRYIGVSNFKAWQVMKGLAISDSHGWARFVAGQYQYSLVKRDIEYEFSDLCLSEGIGLTPWGPLGGGFLSGKYKPGEQPQDGSQGRIATTSSETEESWERRSNERNWKIVETVAQVAQEYGASQPQVALAWLRAQPFVSSVILGARTMEQLEDNLGAASLELQPETIQKLNQASALPELYPYRMIQDYAMRTPNS